jgi:CheY-like chemotaxis protein
MSEAQRRPLHNVRVLIVEDEYAVAADLTWWLEDSGAQVIGPAATIDDAMDLVRIHGATLNQAVLDISLRGEKVFPIADALLKLDVPFVFSTGYEDAALPPAHARAVRLTKPLNRAALIAALASTASAARCGRLD